MYPQGEQEEKWKSLILHIRPGESWGKPHGKTCYLTNVSFAVNYGQEEGYKGILATETWDESAIICVLLPDHPSQKTNLVWSQNQTVYFINKGNRGLTLTLLIK